MKGKQKSAKRMRVKNGNDEENGKKRIREEEKVNVSEGMIKKIGV